MWQIITLSAINEREQTYAIGDFSYTRAKGEALFPKRHDLEELQNLRLQMGEDEFSTQYLQIPQAREAGFFEEIYFKEIPNFELGANEEYIFVDNAESMNVKSDNRAIVVIGVENYKASVRYVVKNCFYGIWDEEATLSHLIQTLVEYPKAKCFIESDGGGITLHRLLLKEIVRVNETLKSAGKVPIANTITLYTPSRKISKVEKIKALKPYYNTGYLVFLNKAYGLSQIKKELLSFNPEKPFRKDDCIDCIASALAHSEVIPPPKEEIIPQIKERIANPTPQWRI